VVLTTTTGREMPPPEALVDELTCRLPTYLREQLNITDITAATGAGCEAAALEDWARRTGYALPDDLRAFLVVADGLTCDWAVDVKTRGPAAVGALRVHALADMVPVPLDGGDDDAFRRDGGGGRVERAFELDRSARVGRVCLAFRSERDAPEVWLQDLACGWHYLAPSFTYYLRLAFAHLGVRGWQGCYAPCGADPVARQWLRLYCPERLHASDRASAPAATASSS